MKRDSVGSAMGRLLETLGLTVADVGARGGFDTDLISVARATTMIGFEPEPEEVRRLAQASKGPWRGLQILPYAIGGATGPGTLYLPEAPQAASLIPHNAEMVDLFGHEQLHLDRREISVQVHTLDDLTARGVLPRIDYLKIDIEGAELDVLKSGRAVLKSCVAAKVECSFLSQRVNQPLLWEVASFLIQEGFSVVDVRDVHRWRRRPLPAHPYRCGFEMPYSRGQVAQCDLVLLKRPQNLCDDDQAMRLISIASVLGYFDYAISVIRERPGLLAATKRKFELDLEQELKEWSRKEGAVQSRAAIGRSLRKMVPLVRSMFGFLPFQPPKRRY